MAHFIAPEHFSIEQTILCNVLCNLPFADAQEAISFTFTNPDTGERTGELVDLENAPSTELPVQLITDDVVIKAVDEGFARLQGSIDRLTGSLNSVVIKKPKGKK